MDILDRPSLPPSSLHPSPGPSPHLRSLLAPSSPSSRAPQAPSRSCQPTPSSHLERPCTQRSPQHPAWSTAQRAHARTRARRCSARSAFCVLRSAFCVLRETRGAGHGARGRRVGVALKGTKREGKRPAERVKCACDLGNCGERLRVFGFRVGVSGRRGVINMQTDCECGPCGLGAV